MTFSAIINREQSVTPVTLPSNQYLKPMFPPLMWENYVHLLSYLPIKDQINLSLTCRHAKFITDFTLRLRSKEYGCSYPSKSLPHTTKAKKFLKQLFEVVNNLINQNFLLENEVHVEKVCRHFLVIKRKKYDFEKTLQIISSLTLNRVAELYSLKSFYEVKSIQSLHFFLSKKHFHILQAKGYNEESRKLNHALLVATYALDGIACELLLKKGAVPNFHYVNSLSPLQYAAESGQCQLVKLFLCYRADVNFMGKTGKTALECAVVNGHVDVVRLLLENGADPNLAALDGFIPLHTASALGKIEMMKLLIEHNAKIDDQSWLGYTPLKAAFNGKKFEAVKLLLKHGADPNIQNNKGNSLLSAAENRGDHTLVELIKSCQKSNSSS